MTRQRGEEGAVAGVEVVVLGVLVLVVGSLLVANVWGVIDARAAAESAAASAARAYVEAPDEGAAIRDGTVAALTSMGDRARRAEAVRIAAPPPGTFARCATATWSVSVDVPVVRLPWIGGLDAAVLTARASRTELVDPYRAGLPVEEDGGAGCP